MLGMIRRMLLTEHQVDLTLVSSVASNVSSNSDSDSSTSTLKTLPQPSSSTRITIHGYECSTASTSDTSHHHTRSDSNKSINAGKEVVLLILYPQSQCLASEWLDGLLMLLNQQPITAETNTLISLVSNYGLKIRLLNVRFDDAELADEEPEIPSREGLNEDYYYDVFGGT